MTTTITFPQLRGAVGAEDPGRHPHMVRGRDAGKRDRHAPLRERPLPDGSGIHRRSGKWWNLFAGFAVAKRIQSPPLIAVSRRPYGYDLRESQLRPYYTDAYLALKEKLLS